MSKSRRKTPIIGITTAISEKREKQIINRTLRRKSRAILKNSQDDAIFPDKNDIMTKWQMSKDGKQRFDPKKKPNLMRK